MIFFLFSSLWERDSAILFYNFLFLEIFIFFLRIFYFSGVVRALVNFGSTFAYLKIRSGKKISFPWFRLMDGNNLLIVWEIGLMATKNRVFSYSFLIFSGIFTFKQGQDSLVWRWADIYRKIVNVSMYQSKTVLAINFIASHHSDSF